jgi:hypothetical protein
VPYSPQIVGEGADAGCKAQSVVEHGDIGHAIAHSLPSGPASRTHGEMELVSGTAPHDARKPENMHRLGSACKHSFGRQALP